MNLLYLAQGGLSAAQAALNVVGNNLSNATVAGYSRQDIILGEAGGKSTNYGFLGYGVQVNDVQRAYDSFLNNQVRGASTEFSAQESRYEQASQIDDMLGDDTSNISTTLGDLFNAMESVSSDPTDPAARQGVLSQFDALANQFRSNGKTLDGLEKSTNTQIGQSVDDINACTKELADLNTQIAKIHGQTGGMPSDLLDQRDQLLSQLSTDIGVKVTEDSDTGCVNVSLDNGMALVNGDKSYQLQSSQSADDPNKTVVSYTDASGNSFPLDEDKTSGKLGGLFKFRNTDLVDAKNQLNQLALQMATKFNSVNKAGYDGNGDQGGDIFSLADPTAQANANNTGNASLDVALNDATAVKAEDYTVAYEGPSSTDWTVTTSDGRTVSPTVNDDGSLSFEGITITPDGSAQPGDSFSLNPVAGAADSLNVAITDGDQIAAAKSSDPSDKSDNQNILDMIAIKDDQVVGNMTLTGAYANLVSSVGSSVSSLSAAVDTSQKACAQWAEQQQSVSGVDMTEESVHLELYTQYYQANAQVLQTANTIFDSLLSIKQ